MSSEPTSTTLTQTPASEPPLPELVAEVLRACYADAVARYPEEACGLLLGPRGEPVCDEARVCENQQNRLHALDPETYVRDARTAYNLAPRDVLFLSRSLEGERPVKVIYHSHVEVGAYFSQEDERAALFDGELVYPVDYLVIDCRRDGVRGARLFRFRDGKFVAVRELPAAI
ncbi:MAG: Mov34/MPN/PAD-1 family protein [Polyangia bacterium]